MFVCEVCGSVAPPRTRSHRIVVETRATVHPPRSDAHWHPPRAGGKGKWVDDPGGRGTQIVRELRACESCATKAPAIERYSEAPGIEVRAA
jgi:hypothetical protein